MILMAVDPGLAACGVAMFHLKRDGEVILANLSVYTTSNDKTFLERCEEHEQDMTQAFFHAPDLVATIQGPSQLAIEYPSYPPSASSAVKLFASLAIITSLMRRRGVPIAAYTPLSWHKKLGIEKQPSRAASKAAVRAYCERRWERLVLGSYLAEIKKAHHEHAYDALAVGATWLEERKAGIR